MTNIYGTNDIKKIHPDKDKTGKRANDHTYLIDVFVPKYKAILNYS